MAAQVQALRQLRDGALMGEPAGASFMAAFSAVYYSFSPAVADLERASPEFREAVRVAMAPMLASLSLLEHAGDGSAASLLAAGMAVLLLNAGLYVAAPAALVWQAARLAGRR